MNSRLFPVLFIAFILLAGLIIYIDKKIILPQRKLKMPDVQEVRMPENNVKTSDIDAYFNTKEEIKKRGEIKEKIAVGNNVPAKQNPFLFPEEILLLKFGKENLSNKKLASQESADIDDKDTISPSSDFHLSMIMMGQNQKIALVNQQFVIEGDNIEEFKVEKISKKSITLVNQEETREILLEPDFVPLVHKSSDMQIDLTDKSETVQEVKQSDETGNLKKQLQDVLKMYDQIYDKQSN